MSTSGPAWRLQEPGKESVNPEASIEGWGWGSIGVNGILSLLNLGIAMASGSLAVAAEMVHKAKGIRVAEWLVSLKVDRVVHKENLHGKGPEYVFANAGVEMRLTDADTLSLALDVLGI